MATPERIYIKVLIHSFLSNTMARGQQAVQAQQKNAKKKAKERKQAASKGSFQPGKLSDKALAKSAKCIICKIAFSLF